MPSKIKHGLLISLLVIGLLVAWFGSSYAETTTYVYDELNRLIGVIYEDGSAQFYTYDASGNRITLGPDTVPPTGTIVINSGDATTNNPSVTLTLTCSDNVSCSQMQFSNDNVTYSTPEGYGATKSWTLSPGTGTKTVYAKFKDAAGNWSVPYSDTIDLLTDSYTKSLLHMNGADGSTTFTDSAGGGTHTWTAHGNAQIDTAQTKFGGASGLFDGSGDYVHSTHSSDWDFGTGDFTVDFWIKINVAPASGNYYGLFTNYSSSGYEPGIEVYLIKNYQSVTGFRIWVNGAARNYSYSYSTGAWIHVAIVRSSGIIKLFVDGIQNGTNWSNSSNLSNASSVARFAAIYNGGQGFNGWMDECRISKGIARWTSNFTPPTSEY